MLDITPGDWYVFLPENKGCHIDYEINAMARLGRVQTIAFCNSLGDAKLMAASKQMYQWLRSILENPQEIASMPNLQLDLKKFLDNIVDCQED